MRRFYPVSEREVIICRDVNELNRKAAQQFIALAGEAISQTGRFSVALSGGSTPKGLGIARYSRVSESRRLDPGSSFLGR